MQTSAISGNGVPALAARLVENRRAIVAHDVRLIRENVDELLDGLLRRRREDLVEHDHVGDLGSGGGGGVGRGATTQLTQRFQQLFSSSLLVHLRVARQAGVPFVQHLLDVVLEDAEATRVGGSRAGRRRRVVGEESDEVG